jgi:ribonuclease P protein component
LRIIYLTRIPDPVTPAMAVSVPKRLFRRAVDRNLLKRRIREAYRLNKSELYQLLENKQTGLHLIIQYQKREIESFKIIEQAVIEGLSMMRDKLRE